MGEGEGEGGLVPPAEQLCVRSEGRRDSSIDKQPALVEVESRSRACCKVPVFYGRRNGIRSASQWHVGSKHHSNQESTMHKTKLSP